MDVIELAIFIVMCINEKYDIGTAFLGQTLFRTI